ncbi:MAG: lysophospholipid acyltransferase family protein [Acidimicrobiales bacterium]
MLQELAGAIRRRVPVADLDDRDPDYIREVLPLAWLYTTLWHRAEVRGLDLVPRDGPVLLVGNHSGGNMSPDTFAFTLAFISFFGVERRFHQLAHDLVVSMPLPVNLRKFGTVAASRANAEKALAAGAAVLVYPGGDYEVHRPSWEAGTVDFGGRKGFLRLAIDRDVPIVPVVSAGGQETALFLSRGTWLARLLGIDRLLRLKVMPISVTVPWGLTVGDLIPRLPLPAKLTTQVLPPFDVTAEFGDDPDVDAVDVELRTRMQRALNALMAERRLPLVG